MALVQLYSKDDCHLCDVAHDLLVEIQKQVPFALQMITLHEGHERYEEFKERFPVVFIDGTFAFQYRIPEKAFIQRIQQAVKTSA